MCDAQHCRPQQQRYRITGVMSLCGIAVATNRFDSPGYAKTISNRYRVIVRQERVRVACSWEQNTRASGRVVKLVNTADLKSAAYACRFKSDRAHHYVVLCPRSPMAEALVLGTKCWGFKSLRGYHFANTGKTLYKYRYVTSNPARLST